MNEDTAAAGLAARGPLVNLRVSPAEESALREAAAAMPALVLSGRCRALLDLLADGVLTPLDRFMSAADYQAVLALRQLADGSPFPLPITLSWPADLAVPEGGQVLLRSTAQELLGVLTVEEVYEVGPEIDPDIVSRVRVSGPVQAFSRVAPRAFPGERRSPAEVHQWLAAQAASRLLVWQPQGLVHRGHRELLAAIAAERQAALLVNLPLSPSRVGALEPLTRLRLAQSATDGSAMLLNVVPDLAMPDAAGELLWQALGARNYGATELLLPAGDIDDATQGTLAALGLTPVPLPASCRLPGQGREVPTRVTPAAADAELFAPELAPLVARAFPPPREGGFCVWLTGLPSAGKSTIAEQVVARLNDHGREVTLLDGDVVRTHLSRGLGFTKEDRDTNIRRIGFVASEIVRHQGVVVVAAVSPYEATREEVRQMVGEERFHLCFVSTPVGVCEERDVKGFYAQARAGRIWGFTGVDDPYEEPARPALVLDTVANQAEANAQQVIDSLVDRGLL